MAEKVLPTSGFLQNGTEIDILIWKGPRPGLLDAQPPLHVSYAGETQRFVNGRRKTVHKWMVSDGAFSIRSRDGQRYIERVGAEIRVEGDPVILLTTDRNVVVETPEEVIRLEPIPSRRA